MTLYTRGFSHFVTSMTAPIASGWSNIAGWDSHPLRNAAFARRTPEPDLRYVFINCYSFHAPFSGTHISLHFSPDYSFLTTFRDITHG